MDVIFVLGVEVLTTDGLTLWRDKNRVVKNLLKLSKLENITKLDNL